MDVCSAALTFYTGDHGQLTCGSAPSQPSAIEEAKTTLERIRIALERQIMEATPQVENGVMEKTRRALLTLMRDEAVVRGLLGC